MSDEQDWARAFYNPVGVDGRTLVVIRQTPLGFEAVESGWLSYDGSQLTLRLNSGERIITVDELNEMKLVAPSSRIPACDGFDFFRIVGS